MGNSKLAETDWAWLQSEKVLPAATPAYLNDVQMDVEFAAIIEVLILCEASARRPGPPSISPRRVRARWRQRAD